MGFSDFCHHRYISNNIQKYIEAVRMRRRVAYEPTSKKPTTPASAGADGIKKDRRMKAVLTFIFP